VGLEFLDVPEEMASRLAAILQKDEEYARQLATPEPRDPVWDDLDDEDEQEDEKKQ